ncbi:UDP-N-acetylglucosamine 1-carboxyvinyltransferase [Pseudoroseicyclus aestuarii]|uniref:UDP-N-acetylglucosamine 1-carboxyvinyltransferase n=1 Tax=Pseudoroseicyclus aestuarii TaxID=1795041 RepID=A0A318SWM4_9RHOB|nr:UDP-N-acetylglucosamine 1-carboxyvinyltransferase [Pseudoroseicyclus aestuarii]PYE85873.1 UDP-N-acetylglucosamine 1-carboxyvinyltransferase [Pseudoroseicyclus aestuarii]
MANLIVNGGVPLNGRIRPSGNKNAVLPMMCASLLTAEPVTFTNVPDITDVAKIGAYFREIGSEVEHDVEAGTLRLHHPKTLDPAGAEHLPLGIRSAVLLLAPVLHRMGRLRFDVDAKGCALGIREIDPHIDTLTTFGAALDKSGGIDLTLKTRPEARSIWAEYASVTATETFAMIAAVAEGTSVLTNAASEPHVQALCRMLSDMGAGVEGIGTSRLTIKGRDRLGGTTQRVPDDHHEVATFLAFGGVTGGQVTVETDIIAEMPLILEQFGKLGLQFETREGEVTVTGWTRQVTQPLTQQMTAKIEAAPWPYFPADLLPQAVGVAVGCEGDVMFWNKVYEGALAWSSELAKFGVRAHLSDPHRLILFGGNRLKPAEVEAPYIIRVVVGLAIAAMQIEGRSKILKADPLRRAHPNLIENLTRLGADIAWEG